MRRTYKGVFNHCICIKKRIALFNALLLGWSILHDWGSTNSIVSFPLWFDESFTALNMTGTWVRSKKRPLSLLIWANIQFITIYHYHAHIILWLFWLIYTVCDNMETGGKPCSLTETDPSRICMWKYIEKCFLESELCGGVFHNLFKIEIIMIAHDVHM